jgi:uncharacterized protein YcnI
MTKYSVQTARVAAFALCFVSASVLGALTASAHVVVTPAQAGVASWTTFKVAVPSEKAISTYKVRLDLPEGLKHVTPNVKPGWTITTTRVGVGADSRISEITWTGGPIPAERRDEFFFSAQVPAEPTTLKWNAYQTYTDGSIVSWNAEPQVAGHDAAVAQDFSKSGPYSKTEVVNDLAATTAAPAPSNKLGSLALVISLLAALAAGISLRKSHAGK